MSKKTSKYIHKYIIKCVCSHQATREHTHLCGISNTDPYLAVLHLSIFIYSYIHLLLCDNIRVCHLFVVFDWFSRTWLMNALISIDWYTDLSETSRVCHCNTLQNTATHCSTLQHTTTHYSTLHHTAPRCNTLQHTATHYFTYITWNSTYCNTLQYTAAHGNTLQRNATHCNTLQHTATHCNALQHAATYCNILQRTATHCNTLQRTAPH